MSKKKNKNLVNYIIIGVVLVVCIVYMLATEGLDSMRRAFSSINYWWMPVCLGLMVVYWLTEAATLYMFTKKMNPDVPFSVVFRVTMIGQLFNCITPFASGGQPMQAYYLTKAKLPLGQALTALISRFIIYQGTLTILSAIIILFKYDYFEKNITGFLSLAIIGFVINTIVIVCLLLVGYCKRLVLTVLRWTINLCAKLRWGKGHICNHPEQTYEKWSAEVESFSANMTFARKNLRLTLKASLLTLAQLLAYFALPYFIGLAFGDTTRLNFVNMLCAQAFVLMISSFMPSPGAAGAAEVSFVLFFEKFIMPGTVPYAMLIWRIFVFYLPIVLGALFLKRSKAVDGEMPDEDEMQAQITEAEENLREH